MAYKVNSNIKTANPHSGYFQRGRDFDILFAENINTDMYWDAYNDERDEDAEIFPQWVEDWGGFLFFCDDFITNWDWDGTQWEYSHLTLITKSGQVFHSDHYDTFNNFLKDIKPFSQNHFAAAIMNDNGFEYFWVNGWGGLQRLQEYTGWFDMDVYYDLL